MTQPLSQRDVDVLIALWQFGQAARPMDVGGTSRSHHSNVLNKLCDHGLAERVQIHHGMRGSYRYRTTHLGQQAAAMWTEARALWPTLQWELQPSRAGLCVRGRAYHLTITIDPDRGERSDLIFVARLGRISIGNAPDESASTLGELFTLVWRSMQRWPALVREGIEAPVCSNTMP